MRCLRYCDLWWWEFSIFILWFFKFSLLIQSANSFLLVQLLLSRVCWYITSSTVSPDSVRFIIIHYNLTTHVTTHNQFGNLLLIFLQNNTLFFHPPLLRCVFVLLINPYSSQLFSSHHRILFSYFYGHSFGSCAKNVSLLSLFKLFVFSPFRTDKLRSCGFSIFSFRHFQVRLFGCVKLCSVCFRKYDFNSFVFSLLTGNFNFWFWFSVRVENICSSSVQLKVRTYTSNL